MICANCRTMDCPRPALEPECAPCGNGYTVSVAGPVTAPVDWRTRAIDAEVEVTRLQNAVKSRNRCPYGHSPSQSRGACWYCDAQRNAALLAQLTAEIDAKGGEVSARDLLGMWDVARIRADTAEAALADAKTTAALVRASTQAQFDREMAACAAAGVPWDGADTVERLAGVIVRVHGALNPDIGLTNRSMQAGYRAAAVAVAKALGDPTTNRTGVNPDEPRQ